MVVKLADFVSYVPVLRLNASIRGPKSDSTCCNQVTVTILGTVHVPRDKPPLLLSAESILSVVFNI